MGYKFLEKKLLELNPDRDNSIRALAIKFREKKKKDISKATYKGLDPKSTVGKSTPRTGGAGR